MRWFLEPDSHSRLDCQDNSCYYKKTQGEMRTNGGCRCARNHPTDVERFLRLNYSKALQHIEELEAKK